MSRAPAFRRYGWRDAAALAILAALVGALLVTPIGRLPVVMWDEARLSINALEMLRTGHLLVPTFHGQPDLWNPKPPLATAIGRLLYLVHLAVLLWWLLDRSPKQRANRCARVADATDPAFLVAGASRSAGAAVRHRLRRPGSRGPVRASGPGLSLSRQP